MSSPPVDLPLILPSAPVLARATAIADELPFPVDVREVVTGRAARTGLRSRGRISAGGSCRLLPAADGWVAVNLARPSDTEAVPAVVEAAVDVDDPWGAVAAWAATRPAREVADRCQLLDVPGAVLDDPAVDPRDAVVVERLGDTAPPSAAPLVVDLSAMWAGPLCAHLLGRAGMRVVKVESVHRPDGARRGDAGFYAWLHHGHDEVVLDLRTSVGRAELGALVARADVVIEASRPRALAQLGIDARRVVAHGRGPTWVSITGYGRTGAAAQRVAFGDDAAVAGGLVAHDDAGLPVFCADAVADPLTGLVAAAAALGAHRAGGGRLVSVAMAAVAAAFARAA